LSQAILSFNHEQYRVKAFVGQTVIYMCIFIIIIFFSDLESLWKLKKKKNSHEQSWKTWNFYSEYAFFLV